MTLVPAFLLIFVAGPAAFWFLARQAPKRRYFLCLWVGAAALLGLAFILRMRLDMTMPSSPYAGLPVIGMLWAGWIVVLALSVLAVRARDFDPRYERYALVFGAVATTLPWLGLAAAQMIAGQ